MNYFELFDLPVGFYVDKSLLTSKYFSLQKKYHPDFYSSASDDDKEEVMKISADINKAYHTFQNPDKTIEYYLRHKHFLETDEKYELPKDFLMEMMELNEEISEGSAADAKEKISAFSEQLEKDLETLQNKKETELTKSDLTILKEYHFKKKYLHRILERFVD